MVLILVILMLVNSGVSKTPLRVIGGRNATIDEYPYIVRMEVHFKVGAPKPRHRCTCAVITTTWTLTAAHCALDDEIQSEKKGVVRYGHVTDDQQKGIGFSDVIRCVVQPGFRDMAPKAAHNDIGLLQTQPILLKQYGKISAVDYSTIIGHRVVIAGSGITTASADRVNTTLALKKPLQVAEAVVKKCDRIELNYLYPALCVARPCRHKMTTCPGDSGGPLLHPSGIVAVASLGDHSACSDKENVRALSQAVGLYTPVSPYISWIASHVTKKPYIGN